MEDLESGQDSGTVDAAANAIAALLNTQPEEVKKPAPETVQTKQEAPAVAAPVAAEAEPEPSEAQPTTSESPEPEKPEARAEAKVEPPAKTESKPSETERAEVETLTQLNVLVPQLQAAIQGEFADVKTFADLQKIAQEDPARYNRFVIHQAQLQQATAEQQRLAAGQYQRFMQAQVAELKSKFPDYIDPVKGPALRQQFTEYAKAHGFSEQRMAAASASDILTLRKAMQWDKYQAEKAKEPARIQAETEKAKAKAAKAPPVQKPGTVQEDDQGSKVKDSYRQLQKTGRVDDAAKLLEQLFG